MEPRGASSLGSLRASFYRAHALLAVLSVLLDVVFFRGAPRATMVALVVVHAGLFAVILPLGLKHLALVRAPDGTPYGRFVSPNVLTIARVLAIPPVVFGVFHLDLPWVRAGVAVTFTVSALSDLFDGLIGRAFARTSDFGRVIDPLADGLFYSAVGAALLFAGYLPLWYQVVVLARYVPMLVAGTVLFLRHGPIGIEPTRVAKLASFALGVATGLVVAQRTILPSVPDPWVHVALVAGAAAAVASIAEYMVLGLRRLRRTASE